ncbi:fimbrial protein [Escherichia coli]|uniref:fimbrial protein n=1 Tax=Escherichia coli TaxID=562 RepID=UPI0039E167E4
MYGYFFCFIFAVITFFSFPAFSVDVPVTIKGMIIKPSCTINNGQEIEIDFGYINVHRWGNDYERLVKIPINCDSRQENISVIFNGNGPVVDYDTLLTDMNGISIKLYRKDGMGLLFGEKYDNLFISQNESNFLVEFIAKPLKRDNASVNIGEFHATMSLNINYL